MKKKMTDLLSSRGKRKLEHIHFSLQQTEHDSGLKDINLINKSLPEASWEEVDTSYVWLGKTLAQPMFINAITGGGAETKKINASLSRAACETGIGMAVGSQSIAITEKDSRESFIIARKENPKGVIFSNISAGISWRDALFAVEMIEADALQLHLNVPQEIVMHEGERDFRGILDNIAQIVEKCPVPVIVKEVGFGISRETVFQLFNAGVRWIDVGGSGGTNFIGIELMRREQQADSEWGIPTAISIVEVIKTELPVRVIAAGGVSGGHDTAKCLALGAELVAVAGRFLRTLMHCSEKALINEIFSFENELKRTMLMTGAKNLPELGNVPLVITGKGKEWLEQRKINTSVFANRGS